LGEKKVRRVRLLLTPKELYFVIRSLQAWANMIRLYDLRDPYLQYLPKEVIDLHKRLCNKYAKRIAEELGILFLPV